MSMQLLKPEEFTWNVPLADEVLMETVPDVPFMSENFCYTGYDPVSRVGCECTLGPNIACGRLLCEEPGKCIRIRYSGPMQLIPPEELVTPAPRPAALHQVELDRVFTGRAPSAARTVAPPR